MRTVEKLSKLLNKDTNIDEVIFSSNSQKNTKDFLTSLFQSIRSNDVKKFKDTLRSELKTLKEIRGETLKNTIDIIVRLATKFGLGISKEDKKNFETMLLTVAKLPR